MLLGPEPKFSARAAGVCCRSDYRLPVRVGTGNANRDYGGNRQGGADGRSHQGRRSAGNPARRQTVVLDKTGTITEGKPALTDIIPAPGITETELLRLAASVERGSEHPLASAIVAAAQNRHIQLSEATWFQAIAGRGVEARLDAHDVLIGNVALLWERNIDAALFASEMTRLSGEGKTPVLMALDGKAIGVLAVADPIKATTPAAIARLKAMGIRS